MRNFLFIAAFFCLQAMCHTASAQGWKWAVGSSCPNGGLESWNVAADKAGNVYETTNASFLPGDSVSSFGPFSVVDSGGLDWQALLVSTDSNGHYRWAVGTQHSGVFFYNMVVDPYCNTYICGSAFSGFFTFGSKSYRGYGTFLIKVDSSGNVLWIKDLAPGIRGTVVSIKVNSSGCVYAAGEFWGVSYTLGGSTMVNTDPIGGTTDAFFAKYDSSGNPLWARSFGGTWADTVTDFALTNDSELYIMGTSGSASMTVGSDSITPQSAQPFFLAKFSNAGSPLWVRLIDAINPYQRFSPDWFSGITTDGAGSVYMTGNYILLLSVGADTLPNTPDAGLFLIKYDSSGNGKWARTYPNTAYGSGIVTDACGNIFVSAEVAMGAWPGPDPMCIARFDSAGTFEDVVMLTSGGDDERGIAIDNKGNLYVGGDYWLSNFIVGSDTLATTGGATELLFMLKYNYGTGECPITEIPAVQKIPGDDITLFPNPATEECTIHSGQGFPVGSRVAIYDITGRLVGQHPLGSNTVIPLQKLPKGVYECQIFSNGYRVETKKLVVD